MAAGRRPCGGATGSRGSVSPLRWRRARILVGVAGNDLQGPAFGPAARRVGAAPMSPLERAGRLRRPSLAVAVSSGCLYISSSHRLFVGSTSRRPPLGRAPGRSDSRAAGRWRRSTWTVAPPFSHTERILPLTCRLCRLRPRSLAPADFISVLANVVGKKAARRRQGAAPLGLPH